MTIQEFATQLKTKYPQYKDIDDNELVQKTLVKYPQYKSQIDFGASAGPQAPVQSKGIFTKPPENLADELGQKMNEQYIGAGNKIKNSVLGGSAKVQQGLSELNWQDPAEGTKKIALGLADAVTGSMSGAIQALFAPLNTLVGKGVNKFMESDFAKNDPVVQGLVNDPLVKKLHEDLSKFGQENPEMATRLADYLNIVLSVAGSKGLNIPLENPMSAFKGVGSDILEGTQSTLTSLKENTVGKVKSAISGKRLEEVLATPEADVYKLSSAERKAYFENQRSAIEAKSSVAEQKIQKELTAKMEANQVEAEALTKEVASASRDEVVRLRPKIREAMGRQSQEYRRLVDEELAPHVDTPVNGAELKKFIDERFAQNPEQAQVIKSKLGLPDEEAIIAPTKKGELPTIQKAPDTTIGDLYNQTKSLKEEIGTASKKGTRVYTADEKLVDDAISTLTDFMKTKGIDFKAARQFWAKYAPVRNQLVAEAKPFLQSDTQTKTFANTLKRVAEGTDVNNENFIKAVEDILGEKTGKDMKVSLEKLKANDKAKVANEIEAGTRKIEADLLKEKELKQWSDKEFEINRKARVRDWVKRVIIFVTPAVITTKIISDY